MSDKSSLVTAEHFAYIAERTAGDDVFLQDLKRAAAEAGIPAIWVNAAQANLMAILLRLSGARNVVEVGTLAGYSAIAMARALPADGRLATIELEPAHADFAVEWIGRSDVADKVNVLRGAGDDVLPHLEDGSLDAVFLDADKSGYPGYLEHAKRLLRPGGLFMADNAFAFGQLLDADFNDREVPAVRAFNDLMAAETEMTGVIVPAGDGLWVAVRN
jgi:predicted O-methyltransferase YrrM